MHDSRPADVPPECGPDEGRRSCCRYGHRLDLSLADELFGLAAGGLDLAMRRFRLAEASEFGRGGSHWRRLDAPVDGSDGIEDRWTRVYGLPLAEETGSTLAAVSLGTVWPVSADRPRGIDVTTVVCCFTLDHFAIPASIWVAVANGPQGPGLRPARQDPFLWIEDRYFLPDAGREPARHGSILRITMSSSVEVSAHDTNEEVAERFTPLGRWIDRVLRQLNVLSAPPGGGISSMLDIEELGERRADELVGNC